MLKAWTCMQWSENVHVNMNFKFQISFNCTFKHSQCIQKSAILKFRMLQGRYFQIWINTYFNYHFSSASICSSEISMISLFFLLIRPLAALVKWSITCYCINVAFFLLSWIKTLPNLAVPKKSYGCYPFNSMFIQYPYVHIQTKVFRQ